MDQASIVKYRQPIPDDYAAIAALIRADWPDRAVDAARIAAWVARSSCALVAEADESVVGFVRIISDDVSSAYIPMLVVQRVLQAARHRSAAHSSGYPRLFESRDYLGAPRSRGHRAILVEYGVPKLVARDGESAHAWLIGRRGRNKGCS